MWDTVDHTTAGTELTKPGLPVIFGIAEGTVGDGVAVRRERQRVGGVMVRSEHIMEGCAMELMSSVFPQHRAYVGCGAAKECNRLGGSMVSVEIGREGRKVISVPE